MGMGCEVRGVKMWGCAVWVCEGVGWGVGVWGCGWVDAVVHTMVLCYDDITT